MTTVARFAPITLDDLVDEAALLTRVDRKYVVPRAHLEALLTTVDAETRVLEIDGARDFAYESVYFDTDDLLSFRMAAHPRRRRFKVRTRAYVETGGAYLEIKTRGARGATVKDRTEYDPAATERLTAQARDDIGDAFEAIGLDPDRAGDLSPSLVTRYRRATLLAPDGLSRATIDTDLTWLDPTGSGFGLPATVIVETKSGSRASALDRLLWRAGHRPSSVSKYATGMAALDSSLPANRWSRILRGPFAPIHRTEEASCPVAA